MRGTHLGLDHDPARVSRRLRPAAAVAAAAWVGAGAPAALGQDVARLPSTVTAPAPGPPLATRVTPPEIRFRGRITSTEHVLVEVGPSGGPVGILVRQRLTVRGKGDYFLGIPAPLLSVVRGPGSESEPGGQRGLLLWQGFSPGRRVLAADARLLAGAAASYLPIRISVERGPTGPVLIVRNVTGATVRGFSGMIDPREAASALDALRHAVLHDRPAGERYVMVQDLKPTGTFRVEVPMRLDGDVRVAGRRMRVSTIVHGDRALVLRLRRPGNVQLTITAVPVVPLGALRPPGSPTWSAAHKAGRLRAGRRLLRQTLAARFEAARYRQYAQFLANPDRLGPARAVYVFRSATAHRAAAATPSRDANPLLAVVLAAGALACGLALVVWWAHS